MKKQILTVIMLCTLCACGPKQADLDVIPFNQPQPEGVKNLKEIPTSFRGIFAGTDADSLQIEKYCITSKSIWELKISKQEADTSKDIKVSKATLTISGIAENLPYTFRNDTFYISQSETDTLYDLRKDIVRRFKGALVINQPKDSLWNVTLLSIHNKTLQIKKFGPTDIFDKLIRISKGHVVTDQSKKITVLRYLKPTKIQFEQLFNYTDTLIVDSYQKVRMK